MDIGDTSTKIILVVDDEENMLRTVQFILESARYRVHTARNGGEALERIRSHRESGGTFDLILSDIQMPGLTGLELIDEIRSLGVGAPILVMTGYGNREIAEELRRRGCTEFLDKPFEQEELLDRVRGLIGG
jgi:CheY-like chemotaxis protein